MEFISWLDSYLMPSKRRTDISPTAQTIVLEDSGTVIEIQKVPNSLIVLLPTKIGQWRFLKEKPKDKHKDQYGWSARCDFMLLGESKGRYFAILLELKETLIDSKGKEQLRWSLPILHHLVSMFNIDCFSSMSEKDFIIKYFQIGQKWGPNLDKQRVKAGLRESFHYEDHMGIKINCSVDSPVTLRRLLERSA
ncbi:MAG: hypothetical protein OXF76_02085 [Caldilineaceae bacterium]|nr:hypothetical protein [Caldilineaceae bacterium]